MLRGKLPEDEENIRLVELSGILKALRRQKKDSAIGEHLSLTSQKREVFSSQEGTR